VLMLSSTSIEDDEIVGVLKAVMFFSSVSAALTSVGWFVVVSFRGISYYTTLSSLLQIWWILHSSSSVRWT
jgi:hypothetical protein